MARRLAKMVSAALHPLLIPVYTVLAVLFTDTVYSFYTVRVKLYLVWVVALYSAFIPVLAYFLLRRLGRTGRLGAGRDRMRRMLLLVGAACYMLCALTLFKLPSLMLFRKLAVAAALCEIYCLAASSWKVSLHLTAIGAVTAFFIILNVIGVMPFFWAMVVSISAAGALASSRLYLGRHDARQVLAGFAGGFVMCSVALLYI